MTSGKVQTLKGSGSCRGKAGHSLGPAGSPVPPFRGGRLSTCQSSGVSWAPEPPCGPLWARAVCHCAQPSQARVVPGAWWVIKTPVRDGDPGWVRGGRGAGAGDGCGVGAGRAQPPVAMAMSRSSAARLGPLLSPARSTSAPLRAPRPRGLWRGVSPGRGPGYPGGTGGAVGTLPELPLLHPTCRRPAGRSRPQGGVQG